MTPGIHRVVHDILARNEELYAQRNVRDDIMWLDFLAVTEIGHEVWASGRFESRAPRQLKVSTNTQRQKRFELYRSKAKLWRRRL